MKSLINNKAIRRSVLLISLVSILQPYIVLKTQFGPSNECWKCLIIEQTFTTSLMYLLLPLSTIYLVLKRLGINSFFQGLSVVIYYVPVSFIKITIPLFDDRIASWSTFSDQEIWDTAIYMAIPSMAILSSLLVLLLFLINKEPSLKYHPSKEIETKDEKSSPNTTLT